MRRIFLLPIIILASTLSGCGFVAEVSAPRKQASIQRSSAALKADEMFWATLHSGNYQNIQPVLETEAAAYLANPSDPKTAAHIGWLHIWRIAERNRIADLGSTITDDATLARKYFSEAAALDETDARLSGFLASAEMAEGEIHRSEADTRRGYFRMLKAIDAWPEFNLFTGGYVMSQQPASSERFRQALDWQWENLDVCAGEKVNRAAGDYSKYVRLETHEGKARVCWNSWIAPHNFEGFFLNMGDMLVKSGDWRLARRIYENAKLSASYGRWKYREALERRISDAERNVAAFNDTKPAPADDRRIMFQTGYACMACHRE
jgi:uncharacterized protein YceK